MAGQPPLVAGAPGNLGWATGPAAGPAKRPAATSLADLPPRLPAALACGHGAWAASAGDCWERWCTCCSGPPQYAAVGLLKVEAQSAGRLSFAEPKWAAAAIFSTSTRTRKRASIKSRYVIEAALRQPEISRLPSVRRNEPDRSAGSQRTQRHLRRTKNPKSCRSASSATIRRRSPTLVNAVVDTYLNKSRGPRTRR